MGEGLSLWIKIENAVICINCEALYESSSVKCPLCTSPHGKPLSKTILVDNVLQNPIMILPRVEK